MDPTIIKFTYIEEKGRRNGKPRQTTITLKEEQKAVMNFTVYVPNIVVTLRIP